MRTRLIFYDIGEDNLRVKLSNKLESLGFIRIQYSVFCGSHANGQWKLCQKEIEEVLNGEIQEKDKVGVLPLNPVELRNMLYFGDAPDFKTIFNEELVIWI